jgi:peroxiredoxin
MLQAEIAGRTIPSCDGYPSVGHIVPDFQLSSPAGRSVLLSDYREHTNMVLVFNSESRLSTDLLSEIEGHRHYLAEKETSVLVIVPGSQHSAELERALYPGLEILADVDGRVHRSMGADDQSGTSFLLYLSRTDLERFVTYQSAQGKRLSDIEEYSAGLTSSIVNVPNAAPLQWPD